MKKMFTNKKSSCENVPNDMHESLYNLHSNCGSFETLWSGRKSRGPKFQL